MNFNPQVAAKVYDLTSKLMFPAAIAASCYFFPKLFDLFPYEDDGRALSSLRTRFRWIILDTILPPDGNIIYKRDYREKVLDNLFIAGLIFSIAHLRFGGLFNYSQNPGHIALLAGVIIASTSFVYGTRMGLGFGILAISRRFTDSPEIADKLKRLALFIVPSNFKCCFTEEAETIESGLNDLEQEWEINKPVDIKCDAQQLKRLYYLCQNLGKSDQFPIITHGATALEVDDFVKHAQDILRGCFDDWYEKHGEYASVITVDDNDYPDLPLEHRDNALLNVFVDPITNLPIRFPVTVKNKNDGPDYHFERKTILNWIIQNSLNPIDNTPLKLHELKDNLEMQEFIEKEMLRFNIQII